MSIKLIIDQYDTELEESKFFGDILLPEAWLEDNVFSSDEMFLCQINLDDLYENFGRTLLPKRGMLYFFIDYAKRTVARVRYTDGEIDAYTCFNEDWEGDYDVITSCSVEFSDGDTGTAMLVKDENVADGKICLLRYDPAHEEFIDFMQDTDSVLYFLIDEKDLLNKDFSRVELKVV